MTIKYEISISELKSLLELIQEMARRTGINEVVIKSIFKRLNEEHFK